jgi:hypothetical protein
VFAIITIDEINNRQIMLRSCLAKAIGMQAQAKITMILMLAGAPIGRRYLFCIWPDTLVTAHTTMRISTETTIPIIIKPSHARQIQGESIEVQVLTGGVSCNGMGYFHYLARR